MKKKVKGITQRKKNGRHTYTQMMSTMKLRRKKSKEKGIKEQEVRDR